MSSVSQPRPEQLSRRRLLQGALGVAGSVSVAKLLAIYGGGELTHAVAAESGKKGGTLVSMVVAEPTSMDIASGTGQHNYAVMSNVFENLLYWDDKSLAVKGGLAESYEVSKDGLFWTFKLRKGVRFHDGTEMDAEAVKFSYERVLDAQNEYYKLGQPFPLMDFWYGAIDPRRTIVRDKYTVTLALKYPYSPLEDALAWPAAAIVSPTAVKKYRGAFRDHPVGTGPFKFDSWIHNQKVTFTRFDDYWGARVPEVGGAYLDSVVFRPIVEEQTRVTELLAGNIDLAYDLPPDNVAQVKGNPRVQFLETPLGHVWYLVFNTKATPTKDVRVRRAISYAVDKKAIIADILKGTGAPTTGPVPSVIKYAYKEERSLYDPAKAKQLLREAGYPHGFTTKFWVPESGSGMQSPKPMGEAVQAMLQQVGVRLQIQVFEWGAYIAHYAKGLPDDVGMAECSWFTIDAQNIPHLTVTCATVSPKGYNAGYYCNPAVDDLLKRFWATLDKPKQADLMAKLQDIVAQDIPNVYIDTQLDTAGLSKKFTGFSLHPSQLLRFWKTHLA